MAHRLAISLTLWMVIGWLTGCSQIANESATITAGNGGVENRGSNTNNWWNELPRPEWAAFEQVATDQDWFEVYRLDDNIFAIYEPGQYEEVISFLFVGTARSMLFDTGLGIGNIFHVIQQLTDQEVIVVNSHTHYDHVGGNYQFSRIFARDLDYTKASAKGTPHEVMAEWLGEGWVWKPLPDGFDPEAYVSQPFTVTDVISEGFVIDIGGRKFEVLLTPGHAPDSISLIDRSNRLLLTGDTFYLAPLYTHIEGSNFADYAVSAAKLAALETEVDTVLTSHNVPVVSSFYLTALGNAFTAIESGTATFEVTDDNREYFFDGFSVIVKGP